MPHSDALAAQVRADPRWLPHTFDPANGMLAFLQTPRARLSQTAFLADLGGEGGYKGAQLPLAALGTLTSPGNAPVTFIFHTAFCRSTLLVRALEQPGISTGLSEPGIIPVSREPGLPGRKQSALSPGCWRGHGGLARRCSSSRPTTPTCSLRP